MLAKTIVIAAAAISFAAAGCDGGREATLDGAKVRVLVKKNVVKVVDAKKPSVVLVRGELDDAKQPVGEWTRYAPNGTVTASGRYKGWSLASRGSFIPEGLECAAPDGSAMAAVDVKSVCADAPAQFGGQARCGRFVEVKTAKCSPFPLELFYTAAELAHDNMNAIYKGLGEG